ncbi:hypothetical protein BJY04DRAFT_198765 [Aspergillus karnatakaensis]|uniref:uncharacterized protein n=1 Tax=Aspergillus karnatakaensis TaxID=1810916 RepID=UPI003CCD4DAA
MLYKINCAAAREAAAARAEPSTPVFKLKSTRNEIRLARKLLEQNTLALQDECEEDVLGGETTLPCTHEMVKDVAGMTDCGAFNKENEPENRGTSEQFSNILATDVTESLPYEDQAETVEDEKKDSRRSDPPAYVVSHPWHIVDYHLYLCSAERSQTLEARREGVYLYDGAECRRLPYDEFVEDRTLMSQCFPGDQPQLLFGILPIADRQHFADRNPSFDGRHYVLGFDYDCKTLYARHFDWFPHDISDIWCVWDSGRNVYTVTVPDLIHIMETSLEKGEMHVGMGILSSSQYCLALEYNDDPGLEIIIATLWCQWLLDFSEVLFKQNTGCLPDFQERLGTYIEQGRLILQRASYRAWFAVRDGYSKQQYKCKTTINQYTNDLYTFEKSAQDGSLKGQSWNAPGLETCNQIRQDERKQRKKRVEQQLEDLFIAPDKEAIQSQETVLQEILAKSQPRAQSATAIVVEEVPEMLRTPSPRLHQDSRTLSERWLSPGSPETITPVTETFDGHQVIAYHDIPLPVLLERALNLVHAHPDLDTFANRDRLGDLLVEMSSAVSLTGLDEDENWRFEVPL